MTCDRMIGPFRCCSVVQGDCLELCAVLGSGCFDAIIMDPPFGIGFASQPTKWQRRAGMDREYWDEFPPDITNLMHLAPVRIIWGGNYFPLPISKSWLCWYKPGSPPSMGDFELAWTNLDKPTAHFTQSISATNAERVGFPTQKPLALMEWTIKQAGMPETILDPFLGSGTTAVAALKLGRHFLGFEISEAYCKIARDRIALVENQPNLFERTTKMAEQCRLYDGPDKSGALMGELDAMVELQMLKESK